MNLQDEEQLLESWIQEKKINFPLEEGDDLSIYKNVTYLLAKIYWRTDWRKIARSPKIRAEDVFQHRLKVAGTMSSVPRFVEKLCNLLSLQNVSISSTIIDELELKKKETLRILREESIYISRKTIELVSLFREAVKKKDDAT